MFFGAEPTILLLIPVMILAFYAQAKVKGNFNKFSKIRNTVQMTGADVARIILDRNGLQDVKVLPVKGVLTDHYDPRIHEVHLSEGVYGIDSVAAISVAAHECGHALQHAAGYKPIIIRSKLVPIANLGSWAAFPLFLAGFFFQITGLMDLGIIFFIGALAFHLVTLPVEFNASQRAFEQLGDKIVVNDAEMKYVKKVLNAAALTYVASTLMAFMQLVRLILLRGSRD